MSGFGITLKETSHYLETLTPFSTGTLSGEWATDWDNEFGFIVRSYGVVIARNVVVNSKGVVFEHAYNHSKTTSKHANIVKRAWGLN